MPVQFVYCRLTPQLLLMLLLAHPEIFFVIPEQIVLHKRMSQSEFTSFNCNAR